MDQVFWDRIFDWESKHIFVLEAVSTQLDDFDKTFLNSFETQALYLLEMENLSDKTCCENQNLDKKFINL